MSARTRDEYNAIKPRAPRLVDTSHLQAVIQQEVRVDALTGHPDWDYYNRFIEAEIRASEAFRTHEEQVLRNPMLVDDLVIRQTKIKIAGLDARIVALREVLMIPKFLREQGELARRQIDAMSRDAG